MQFAAGQTTLTKAVLPNAENAVEGPETVRVTVHSTITYSVGTPNSATVTIIDND